MAHADDTKRGRQNARRGRPSVDFESGFVNHWHTDWILWRACLHNRAPVVKRDGGGEFD